MKPTDSSTGAGRAIRAVRAYGRTLMLLWLRLRHRATFLIPREARRPRRLDAPRQDPKQPKVHRHHQPAGYWGMFPWRDAVESNSRHPVFASGHATTSAEGELSSGRGVATHDRRNLVERHIEHIVQHTLNA
jgi:hypothetical protein